MFRGFRWQVLALLFALALFAMSIVTRIQSLPQVTPTPTQSATATPTPIAILATETPAGPSPTPLPAGTGTLREGLVGDIARLNPVFADLNPVDRDITSLIYEGLMRTNDYGEPIFALANSLVISSDGLEYVFTLRNDVLWQDGTPFTARDVGYTMEILRSPDFPGSDGRTRFWRTVETEILGDYLVRFRLTQPLATFLDELQIGILPEHALRGTNAAQLASHPFNLTPIGTGPYQLERIIMGSDGRATQVRLRAAPVYRQRLQTGGGYSIERIQFDLFPTFDAAAQALNRGDIDALAAGSRAERQRLFDVTNASTTLNLYTQIEPTLGVLIFNWERESTRFFREQRVRVALQTGLDRASVIERNLSNIAVEADSPLMPGSWAYLPDLPWAAYDPASARAQLDVANQRAATATPVPEGEPTLPPSSGSYNFSILVANDPALVAVAQEIATQWAQLNVNVTVDAVTTDTYRQRLTNGEFDSALVELSLGTSADPDIYAFWHQGQTAPNGLNYGAADDGRISELLERARRDASGINRIELYRRFQQQFVERAIAIPLYYPLFTYVVSRTVNGVQLGFMGAPDDRFRTLSDWQIN
ncbi:MAG: ABC transporter substrate-binding protein [Chloroflexota bacterium]|nr:ABC transporter substrate-binding protein [Chloroflexota bacterium]